MTVIGVLSGKGGVGKTTLVANLGVSLTRDFKQNVIIVDANINSSHLGMHLGMYEDPNVTLKDVLNKNTPVSYAVYVHPTIGVRLLPAPLNAGDVKLEKIKKVVEELERTYDIVILDTAPGLGKEVMTVLPSIDTSFIVTTPDLPAVSNSLKSLNLLQKFRKNAAGVVVNRVTKKRYELLNSEIENAFNRNIVALIPEDGKVPESIYKGIPLVMFSKNSRASLEIKKFAARIIGKKYETGGMMEKIRDMFRFLVGSNYDEELPPIIPKSMPTNRKIKKLPVPEKVEEPEEENGEDEDEKEVKDVKVLEKEVEDELKEELKAEVLKKVRKKLGYR